MLRIRKNKDYSLYIPQGLKTRVEIFDGYATEELFKTIIVIILAGAISYILYITTKNTAISIVTLLVSVAGSVIMQTKDKSNISVVDQLGFMIKFAKSQKRYKYIYLDEWE